MLQLLKVTTGFFSHLPWKCYLITTSVPCKLSVTDSHSKVWNKNGYLIQWEKNSPGYYILSTALTKSVKLLAWKKYWKFRHGTAILLQKLFFYSNNNLLCCFIIARLFCTSNLKMNVVTVCTFNLKSEGSIYWILIYLRECYWGY